MVFWITWTLQILIFGVMALILPYREGKGRRFWLTRLYVLGIGIRPFARWQIALGLCFLWLGPWGTALFVHTYI